MEYNKSSHYVYSCKYHIIFCPKYRSKVLKDGINKRLKEIIYSLEKEKFKVIEMEIMPDHVYLLLDCSLYESPIHIVKHIKHQSSLILKKEFPYLRSKLPNLWTRSAFISTVGTTSLKVAQEYIKNQKGK